MKKKIILILSLISVILLSFLYSSFNNIFNLADKVVVGPKWVNQAQFAGIFSAMERGIYEKYDLDVSVKEFGFETSQFEDLMSGKTDFAILSAEEFLILIDQGAPIKAIAAIYQVSPYAIVSLGEKNINTPADFRGKVLGNKGGKLEETLIYRLLLSSVGLTEADVRIVNLGFDNYEYQDLMMRKADAVDLYRTDQLYFFNKEKLDYDIIYPENYGTSTINDIIVSRTDFIENNPEIVEGFVLATVEGWEYALENSENAVEDTLKYVTHDEYKDPDYELFILNQSKPLIKPDDDTVIGSMTRNQWDSLYRRMKSRNFLNKDIIIENIFTTDFLP